MIFREFIAREKHVALNAQSRKFRIVKWIVILLIATALYRWKGMNAVVTFIAIGAIAGVILHFFLRWKTDEWTKSWGPYTRIPLNGE